MDKLEKQKNKKLSPKTPPQKTLPEHFKAAYSKTRPYIAISLVVALQLISFIPSDIAKISVLIILGISLAFMTGDLANLVKTEVGEIKSLLGDINKNIKEIEDPLHKAAFSSNLENPQAEVARKMFEASVRSANQLKNPQVFKTHYEYTEALRIRVRRMKDAKYGKISAACGEKDWNNRFVQGWFEENYEALKHNVSITRIFLEEKAWETDGGRSEKANEQMQKQADNGINVRFAKQNELQSIEVFKDFSEGFGFVIFKYMEEAPEVIVHNKPTEGESVLFNDPLIVSQFISAFNELSKDFYSSEIKSDKQMNAGLLLENSVIEALDKINSQVNQLLDHRFSNIQLYFVKWRLESELKNIESLVGGNVSMFATDKFTYLTDVFRHVIEQLEKDDIYQTISTVDFWCANIPISKKCLNATSKALRKGAKIERLIYVDGEKLIADGNYCREIKVIISLFEGFDENNNNLYSIGFFICNLENEIYGELLRYSPRAVITEANKRCRLQITTIHERPSIGNIAPRLKLKFYSEEETDTSIEEMDTNFQQAVEVSLTIEQMKEKLRNI